jgi:hypothetical protein
MNTIKIKQKVETFTEIQLPYFGKSDTTYICIMKMDVYGNLRGMTIRPAVPAIATTILYSDFHESQPCTPAEFAAAFMESHNNLRVEYEKIIQAQEGGNK